MHTAFLPCDSCLSGDLPMKKTGTFKSGIHPLARIHHGKPLSEECAIEVLPAPKIVRIPLSQHIGAPARPTVAEGDYVRIGQIVGEASGFVSAACHASVSGRVIGIENIPGIMGKMIPAVVIENDFQDTRDETGPVDYTLLEKEQIIDMIRYAGIVGMGGATFPTHVKLSIPADKKVDTFIINAVECEPFLTADHRLMLEYPEEIVKGTEIILKALGVDKAYMGIEDNKQNAIVTMTKAASGHALDVVELKTKYPQGSEKHLIYAVTGREVPSGGLPADAGCVVSNVATVKAVYDAFCLGHPLTERVVTVTGSVEKPSNFLVRIGTPLSVLIEAAGGFKGDPMKIISGGPMMGLPVPSMDCVVVKGTSGLLVLGKEYMKRKERLTACIQCGKCAQGCPMFLMPMRIAACAEKEQFETAEKYNALDCINCGSCSYVCPAKRHVSQYVKLAKDEVMRIRAERKKAEAAKAEASEDKKKD